MAVTAAQRNITKPKSMVTTSTKPPPTCSYRISPELIFTVLGVIILPFLMPIVHLVTTMLNILFRSWVPLVSAGALVFFTTTMAFLKVLALGAGLLTITLVLLYLYYSRVSGNSKGCGVIAGFGDFCLSLSYSVGLPVPGSVINFLASDSK